MKVEKCVHTEITETIKIELTKEEAQDLIDILYTAAVPYSKKQRMISFIQDFHSNLYNKLM